MVRELWPRESGWALNVQDIDAYWLLLPIDRPPRESGWALNVQDIDAYWLLLPIDRPPRELGWALNVQDIDAYWLLLPIDRPPRESGWTLNVHDIDAYWLYLTTDRFIQPVTLIYHHLVPHFPWFKEPKPRKVHFSDNVDLYLCHTVPFLLIPIKISDSTRLSRNLTNSARQEMLRQRKIAHGGHEVGDTNEDPLLIPSDEEKEAVILSPPKAEVDSPFNPNYDSDYQEFLTEFLADDSLGNTSPTSPPAATPDIIFPITPSTALEADPPSPPSQTPSMVSVDSPTASA
nr:uncharacterized protein LOC109166971 [Ipomoea batatas]